MTDADEFDAVMLEIGDREHLTDESARQAATAFRLARARYPTAQIHLCIGGWDEDPRQLWEIPEVWLYVQYWARLARVDDWRVALALPWVDFSTIALLANCRAFGELTSEMVVEIEAARGRFAGVRRS